MSAPQPIRDAASVILLRQDRAQPEVLMGQRGAGAVFMPSKFVFPGGARDPQDALLHDFAPLDSASLEKLETDAPSGIGTSLGLAAVRELWEETGLKLGTRGTAQKAVPADWQGFFEAGLVPDLTKLRFIFRAITPPGRPRRFDARFFMADAADIHDDLDDFSDACDELSHLHWVGLTEARSLNLPFITSIVLSELSAILSEPGPHPIPFFHHDEERSYFRAL